MSEPGRDNSPRRIRATLMGQVRVSVGDRLIGDDAWSLRSARALFLLLLITPGHAMSSERVRDMLWPEADPDVGRNALYKALHLLRRVLEPELASARDSAYIESRGGTIGITASVDVRLDVETFDAALRRATLAPLDTQRRLLREAISLYGGELLPTERYEDWPIARREALRFAWENAILDLAQLDLDADEPQASVPTLELLLATDGTIESAHRALMQAYVAAGQRDRAIRQYTRCATALENALGVDPEDDTQALFAQIQATPVIQPERPVGPFNNLPAPPTPLVGRDREISILNGTLWRQDVRLLTLIGPGGVGKTRLAIEAAAEIAADIADGVAFVPLAAVRDPALVPQTIASVLGVQEEANTPIGESLIAYLGSREMLLVIDNVEQVLGAAAYLSELLARCPRVTMLVTSRERLRLRGELLHHVAPLAVPRPERLPTPSLLSRYGAVALFTEYMLRIDPDFEITPENSEVVSAICRHLEGLPLAIELATARARLFSLGHLLARLASRLDLDAGPRDLPDRQKTLRATFAWSHDLLSPAEQAVFRRLAVAVGGCGHAAAAAICGESATLDTHLHALAEQHMILWDDTGDEARVGMLETIREYALEQLRAHGEHDTYTWRHADHYLTLAIDAEQHLVGTDQAAWLARLDTEQGNIRAALHWALHQPDGPVETGIHAAVALWRYWLRRRQVQEGIDWLERALARPDTDRERRARTMVALARLHEARSEYARAEELVADALPIARETGDRGTVADALIVRGEIAEDRGNFAEASTSYHEALELYRACGMRRDAAAPLNKLAIIAYYQGNFEDARERWEACVTIIRDRGDLWATGVLLGNLGQVAIAIGDYDRAVALHEENLAIARTLNDPGTIGRELHNLAEALQLRGDGDQDAMLDEALELQRETSDKVSEIATLALVAANALARDDMRRAGNLFARSLRLCQSTGDRANMTNAALFERIAVLALATDQDTGAAQLLGAADALRDELQMPTMPYLRSLQDHGLTQLRARLPRKVLETAVTAGAAMSSDAAILVALDVCERAHASAGSCRKTAATPLPATPPRTPAT